MIKKFDYIVVGSGPAGCVAANYLSKSNKVALIDIASEKKQDDSVRSFPPFVSRNIGPYSPAFSGVLGGNSDLWSGKIYLISEKECLNWPINHDDLLFFSKLLANNLNLNHDNIYHLEKKCNSSYFHRSKRSKLKNVFDNFSIRENPNIVVFPLTSIQKFEFSKETSKINKIVIKKNNKFFSLEIKRDIIISAGGLGSIPLVHQALIENPYLDYKNITYPLQDHAHYSLNLKGGIYQKRLVKGYVKNINSEFEDCLIFHKDNEMLAIQIDGGYTPSFIQKIRSIYFRTGNILFKYILSSFQLLNSLNNLLKRKLGLRKNIPYEFFFSENNLFGKVNVIKNENSGYSIEIEYLENKKQKEKLFKEALNKLSPDIGNSKSIRLPTPYVGLHPSGSIPMQTSYELGAVNKNLLVYGIKNLYTVGSHIFPQNGVTNPTWTIMTLAYRLATYLSKSSSKDKKKT